MLCTKRTNQSKSFENFECSGQNSPNSCHVWISKSVFILILHHCSVSWDITPLDFFNLNFIYFQRKKFIKVKLHTSSQRSKILLFNGFLLSKSCKVSAKNVKKTLKCGAKFNKQLTCCFKYNMRNLVNFHPTTKNPDNFFSMGSFWPKYTRF